MKQTLLLLLALICINAKAVTPEPAITMTTAKNFGETIDFILAANATNTIVQVDFGDGTLVDKTIGTSGTYIRGTLVGSQTVKIYGTSISFLGCYFQSLTALDVTQSTSLTELNCSSNQLTSLDVTKNTALTVLNCDRNQLTSLDVTKNTALLYLFCTNNHLTSLDVTMNSVLTSLNCNSNQLTFATLPLNKPTNVTYSPQQSILIATSFAMNTPIDLSSQLTANGNTTTYIWKTGSGITLTEGIDYTISDGVTTFIKMPNQMVYCEMTNATFPDFTESNVLKTSLTTIGTSSPPIIAEPVITMTTAKNVGETIIFGLAANVANTVIQVDFGDGTLVDKAIGTIETQISGPIIGSQTVKIYGTGITLFNCIFQLLTSINMSNNTSIKKIEIPLNNLTSLDVTKNKALTYLSCISNNLTSLDVTLNTALSTLYCNHNQLTSIDVTHNTALINLGCSINHLKVLDVTPNTALSILHCSYNQLTSLDVTKNTVLTELALSANQLMSLDVTNNTALKSLGCSSNLLTSLDLTNNANLTDLWCDNNRLTFASLPQPFSNSAIFTYAPQSAINIASSYAINTPIDLSSQFNVNGNSTSYTWKTETGIILMAGTDYTLSGGITTFTTIPTEKVYCEMTNATFPDFSRFRVLKTTLTTIGAASAVEDAKADVVDIYTHHQTVHLSLPEDALVQVYDITGHLVKAQTCISGTNSFEVPQKGVFVVKVNMNNQSETRKIVVR